MFLNDDALLEPNALQVHLAEHALRDPKAAVLGTFSMHPDFVHPDSPLGYCLDHSDLVFEYAHLAPGKAYGHHYFYTCNLSLRREFLLRSGGFDERFRHAGAEDIELGLRLEKDGCRLYFRPDCISQHAHALQPRGLARMFEARGFNGVHLFVVAPELTPHYTTMPTSRIASFTAERALLQGPIDALYGAIERLNARPFARTGRASNKLDEIATGLCLKDLWEWPLPQVQRLIQTLQQRVEQHLAHVSTQSIASLESAADCIYPALQFVKWYHDTLGVMAAPQLPGYLASQQRRAVAV